MHHILHEAKQKPYLTTLLKPTPYIPHITTPNFNLKTFPQTTPINTPIQPTPPHIIKKPIIHIPRK
ncbi:hypothetical protein, partial [Bacillus altitudinis]|uniref:hypothetical protein n=1 Tax=Bacillus altitudinis TaxID=293387 RepID=UPI003B51ACB6